MMPIELVRRAVDLLGGLRDECVLVGGCAAALLVDDPAARPPRVTRDIDLIFEVTAYMERITLEER